MTEHVSNYDSFRECLSVFVVQQLTPAPAKAARKRADRRRAQSKAASSHDASDAKTQRNAQTDDTEDLAEFVEYLSDELFNALPAELRTLTYADTRNNEELAARYSTPLPQSTIEAIALLVPASTLDSLETYGLVPSSEQGDVQRVLLQPLLTAYSSAVAAPPANLGPEFGQRPSRCEICGRDWIPLTYHHLIPRAVHAKALKREWHEEWRLNSVAWLCRSCHSCVHKIASNEELAKDLYSVELLMKREEVVGFARWVSGVRWKKR